MTGYARAVHFTADEEDDKVNMTKQYQLTKMVEGRMEKGVIKGYARELHSSVTSQAGFWTALDLPDGKQVSVPCGKWESYLKDGSFRVKPDFYIGKQDPAQKARI